jgi:hypothetical protein
MFINVVYFVRACPYYFRQFTEFGYVNIKMTIKSYESKKITIIIVNIIKV